MNNNETALIEQISSINDKMQKFVETSIFKNSGITFTQYNILNELIVNETKTINDLKQKLVVSAPALSQILSRMEISGLITREINKNNKRETNIKTTKKACDLHKNISEKYLKISSSKLGDFNNSKKQELLKLIQELNNIF